MKTGFVEAILAPMPKVAPYLVAGQRVSYTVPGVGTTPPATFVGRVLKVSNFESFVVFDDGLEHWVDNVELKVEARSNA